jgi:hypothetical protein
MAIVIDEETAVQAPLAAFSTASTTQRAEAPERVN